MVRKKKAAKRERKPRTFKPRNYKAEYAARLARGRAKGLSRQAARGHKRGEGARVRKRPKTKAARQEEKDRGAVLGKYREQLKQGGKDPTSGIVGAKPFRRSLLDPRLRGKTATVVFTFKGAPILEEISPKWKDPTTRKPFSEAFQAVPMRFDERSPPILLKDVFDDLEAWIERAKAKTSLHDPELTDIYVVARTVRSV